MELDTYTKFIMVLMFENMSNLKIISPKTVVWIQNILILFLMYSTDPCFYVCKQNEMSDINKDVFSYSFKSVGVNNPLLLIYGMIIIYMAIKTESLKRLNNDKDNYKLAINILFAVFLWMVLSIYVFNPVRLSFLYNNETVLQNIFSSFKILIATLLYVLTLPFSVYQSYQDFKNNDKIIANRCQIHFQMNALLVIFILAMQCFLSYNFFNAKNEKSVRCCNCGKMNKFKEYIDMFWTNNEPESKQVSLDENEVTKSISILNSTKEKEDVTIIKKLPYKPLNVATQLKEMTLKQERPILDSPTKSKPINVTKPLAISNNSIILRKHSKHEKSTQTIKSLMFLRKLQYNDKHSQTICAEGNKLPIVVDSGTETQHEWQDEFKKHSISSSETSTQVQVCTTEIGCQTLTYTTEISVKNTDNPTECSVKTTNKTFTTTNNNTKTRGNAVKCSIDASTTTHDENRIISNNLQTKSTQSQFLTFAKESQTKNENKTISCQSDRVEFKEQTCQSDIIEFTEQTCKPDKKEFTEQSTQKQLVNANAFDAKSTQIDIATLTQETQTKIKNENKSQSCQSISNVQEQSTQKDLYDTGSKLLVHSLESINIESVIKSFVDQATATLHEFQTDRAIQVDNTPFSCFTYDKSAQTEPEKTESVTSVALPLELNLESNIVEERINAPPQELKITTANKEIQTSEVLFMATDICSASDVNNNNKNNVQYAVNSIAKLTNEITKNSEPIKFKASKTQNNLWYVKLRSDIFLAISYDIMKYQNMIKDQYNSKIELDVTDETIDTMKLFLDNFHKLSKCFEDENESDDESFINGFRL